MRSLKSPFPAHALTTLETVIQQTKAARLFRRAQAVREVITGHHVHAVSATFHWTNFALRKWVQRFAQQPSGFSTQEEHPVLLGLAVLTEAPHPRYVTCSH